MNAIYYNDLYDERKIGLLEASQKALEQFRKLSDAREHCKGYYGIESPEYKSTTREADKAASILHEMQGYVFFKYLEKNLKKKSTN